MDGQYGGAYFAVDSGSGQSPRVHFDACFVVANNDHGFNNQFDIETPYFPEYRIGRDFEIDTLSGSETIQGDLNGDGVVNGSDMGLLLANWTF